MLDLERTVPPIRALALHRWQDAQQALGATPGDPSARAGEVDAFWDWALLALLLHSGEGRARRLAQPHYLVRPSRGFTALAT